MRDSTDGFGTRGQSEWRHVVVVLAVGSIIIVMQDPGGPRSLEHIA